MRRVLFSKGRVEVMLLELPNGNLRFELRIDNKLLRWAEYDEETQPLKRRELLLNEYVKAAQFLLKKEKANPEFFETLYLPWLRSSDPSPLELFRIHGGWLYEGNLEDPEAPFPRKVLFVRDGNYFCMVWKAKERDHYGLIEDDIANGVDEGEDFLLDEIQAEIDEKVNHFISLKEKLSKTEFAKRIKKSWDNYGNFRVPTSGLYEEILPGIGNRPEFLAPKPPRFEKND